MDILLKAHAKVEAGEKISPSHITMLKNFESIIQKRALVPGSVQHLEGKTEVHFSINGAGESQHRYRLKKWDNWCFFQQH